MQELLAGCGVAVGIGLFLGVLAANATLTRGGDELIRGMTGRAQVALVARSWTGFNEKTAEAAGRLPGVRVAVYILRENVSVHGPTGRVPVQLIGVTSNVAELGGTEVRDSSAEAGILAGGLGLPTGVANAIGAHTSDVVKVLARGEVHSVPVRAILSGGHASPLSSSDIAVGLLPVAQQLAGRPHTVSGVLIEPAPGAARLVERGLRRVANGRLEVEPADQELTLLAQAAKPAHQSTSLFAAIGALIGLLLAFDAMLLTVPERRQFGADLLLDGYDWRQVVLITGFQALVLGFVASIVGVGLGEVLSRTVFHQSTTALSLGFPVGTREAIEPRLVGLTLIAGVAATLLASWPAVLRLRLYGSGRSASHAGGAVRTSRRVMFGLSGVFLVLVATLVALALPSLGILSAVVLGLAVPLLVPLVFTSAMRGLDRLSERVASSAIIVSMRELSDTSVRASVVASVVALAVYGTVTVVGSQRDVLAGVYADNSQYFSNGAIWVSAPDDILNNADSFAPAADIHAISALHGVASVRAYRGGQLDVGDRRMWIFAPPPQDSTLIPSSQLVEGASGRANALLRVGGWATVSFDFAESHGLRIGSSFALPTPSGIVHFKVAAITTNLGWPGGAIIINANDYSQYWQSSETAALEINLGTGTSLASGKQAVEAALRNQPGLSVHTKSERVARSDATVRQQLQTLTKISRLLIIATAIAVALALGAAIWQRRARMAALKVLGYESGQLWRALVMESAFILVVGGVVGATTGVYAHLWSSRWLRTFQGFPAPFSLQVSQVGIILALVVGVVLATVAIPGMITARVSPQLSLEE